MPAFENPPQSCKATLRLLMATSDPAKSHNLWIGCTRHSCWARLVNLGQSSLQKFAMMVCGARRRQVLPSFSVLACTLPTRGRGFGHSPLPRVPRNWLTRRQASLSQSVRVRPGCSPWCTQGLDQPELRTKASHQPELRTRNCNLPRHPM